MYVCVGSVLMWVMGWVSLCVWYMYIGVGDGEGVYVRLPTIMILPSDV